MTDHVTQAAELVEVTQADRDAAKPIAIRVALGELTHEQLHQAFARHRLSAELAARSGEAADMKLALQAAVRAADLALFVIRKQGVMPNSSWQRGFDSDMATARAALPTPPANSSMEAPTQ